MNASERRKKIVGLIKPGNEPVSGSAIAKELGVSRQVIVQDIALLKAEGYEIISTHRGYIVSSMPGCSRVLKLRHTNEQTEDELTLIVDLGGTIDDVYVRHKVYGTISAKLNISSRRDVQIFMEGIITGKSKALLNITSGYHYHTIVADSEEVLDLIEAKLKEKGYLIEADAK